MDNDQNKTSRKKFIGLGLTSAALLAYAKFVSPKKEPPARTVKMLGQDGKLVEVSVDRLSVKRTKIDDEQLKTWVKKQS